jgi:hypothetical protein
VIEMPASLIRTPVDSLLIQTAGVFTVSRWALEGYAAQVYGRDLSDHDAFIEAAEVNFFLPATLSNEDVSGRLLAYARGFTAAPNLHPWAPLYLVILVFIVGCEAGALVFIMPLRDPRRASRT